MVEEIKGEEDAALRLKTFFGEVEFLKQYAQMLALLSDEKRFTEGLKKVSALIWEAYNSREIKDAPNRYTRAIVAVANQMFGFACQENVVLTAAAGTKAFGERIRNGVLWKDSFALGHGEFAHSYQWLVAGLVLDWGKGTAKVYKGTAGKRSLVPLFVKDNFGIVLRPAQLWEYVVDSTRYAPAFDKEAKPAAQTWVKEQLEKWSRNELVNTSFANLYFRGTDPQIEGSCGLGVKYEAFAKERTNDSSRNLSVAKKAGKPGKFVDSLAATFPVRNALTATSFRNANNVTDLARRSHTPPWFITVYEDHRQLRLYQRSNVKLRELASELLATEKLNRENSPLRNDETWRKIEALLIEIDLMSGSTEDPNSKTFYADLKSKVVQEASKMGAGKIAEGWFGNLLKGIPALKRERQEHYSGRPKTSQGWKTAPDDMGIFVRKILDSETVRKGQIVWQFHDLPGTVNKNAFPGQLTL
jgi:hypothetical protein